MPRRSRRSATSCVPSTSADRTATPDGTVIGGGGFQEATDSPSAHQTPMPTHRRHRRAVRRSARRRFGPPASCTGIPVRSVNCRSRDIRCSPRQVVINGTAEPPSPRTAKTSNHTDSAAPTTPGEKMGSIGWSGGRRAGVWTRNGPAARTAWHPLEPTLGCASATRQGWLDARALWQERVPAAPRPREQRRPPP